METKLIVANWKMNPAHARDAKRILVGTHKGLSGVKGVAVVVCPPALFLPELAKELKGKNGIELGVQDLFYEEAGAFTGNVSPAMVKPYRVSHAILGHSERREQGETNATVARKVKHVTASGLTAILCVGELVRNDDGAHYTFVREELEAVFEKLRRAELERLVIAYEPIWAIGKRAEEACQTAQLYEMALFIRKLLIERFGKGPAAKVPLLYGGSVKAGNAAELVREGGVDGLLVGSASLDPKEFGRIIKAVA